MAYYIVQGGSTLKQMTTAGALTSLTLPTSVTVDSAKRMRGAVLNGLTILVNSPTENITVDRFGTVRLLCPMPPAVPPVLTATAGGTLSGTFTAWSTFFIEDLYGNIIAESDYSQISNALTVTSQYITTTLPLSTQTVTGRRMYRSTTGPGTVKYHWFDVRDNTRIDARDDMADAALNLLAGPTDFGPPPHFELVAVWKDRLWGKSTEAIDTLYYSAVNKPYAFGPTQTISIPPAGSDIRGITGFLPRKNELGVGRAGSLQRITGSSAANFTRVTETENIGIWAPDSCQVIHDTGYFLGNPFGIYSWGPDGITNISTPKVRAWFDTDTYFNRSQFDQAYGCFNPDLNAYILMLAGVGSTSLDRWIMYDIAAKTWWGPHKTGAFTPTGCTTLRDGNDAPIASFFGSDGILYKPTATKTDGASTAIDFDCDTNWFSGGTPDIFKTWMDPAIISKIQAGGTLTVTPKVGGIDAAAGAAMSHDMTLGRQRLRRIGNGNFLQLKLRENTNAQGVIIYGIELPFFENGRR